MEQQILRLLKKDTDKGMSLLIDRYSGLVYTVVKNRIDGACSAEDIEETVSDVFVAFYRQLDSVDLTRGTLSAYLASIARHKATDRLRKTGAPAALSLEDSEDYLEIPDGINLENEAEKRALYQRLGEMIRSLGEPDSTIVYRRYFLSESAADIATFTGLTGDNVRQRLRRALKKMKTVLEVYYET